MEKVTRIDTNSVVAAMEIRTIVIDEKTATLIMDSLNSFYNENVEEETVCRLLRVLYSTYPDIVKNSKFLDRYNHLWS